MIGRTQNESVDTTIMTGWLGAEQATRTKTEVIM